MQTIANELKTDGIADENIIYIDLDKRGFRSIKQLEELIDKLFDVHGMKYLFSGELVPKLTGRYLEFEMYPLTFEEYLGMKEGTLFC